MESCYFNWSKLEHMQTTSAYNMASKTLKNMVYDGYKTQNNDNLATQYTTVDVRKLPILPISSYFQTLKVKYIL